jgi:hypothetical protein
MTIGRGKRTNIHSNGLWKAERIQDLDEDYLQIEWERESHREATFLDPLGRFSEDEWMFDAYIIGKEFFRVPRREASHPGPEIPDASEDEPMDRTESDLTPRSTWTVSCFDMNRSDHLDLSTQSAQDSDQVPSRLKDIPHQLLRAICFPNTTLGKSAGADETSKNLRFIGVD